TDASDHLAGESSSGQGEKQRGEYSDIDDDDQESPANMVEVQVRFGVQGVQVLQKINQGDTGENGRDD
ncbi:MAG TPA: hypothetical protein PKH31_16715, partial [Candidatus Sumerlaeota bacterium]|nr:hypothetical protein [Candidatus Sumerlaeota bacterium]